jgi:hypothetical protein
VDGGTQTQRGRCVVRLLQRGGETRQWSPLSHCGPTEPEAVTSDSLFAVSVTKSIRGCTFLCSSGMFTLSVTR